MAHPPVSGTPSAMPDEGTPIGSTQRFVSDVIVDQLISMGVRYLPLNPGSSLRGLHDSLAQRPDSPAMILCTHEEIAVAAAHAYAKASGDVGYALIHDLVGLMHASMAIYDAWCDRSPVVVLGGGGPSDPKHRRPVDWFHSATSQSLLVRPYVKWDDDPTTPQATIDAIARAHWEASSAPAGPCYVTLDAAVQEMPDPGLQLAGPPGDQTVISAPAADFERAATMLCSAEFPVIVAGGIGLDVDAGRLAAELAEVLGAACADERNLTALPTNHPLNLTGDPALFADADLVLAVDAHDLNYVAHQCSRPLPTFIDLSLRHLAVRPWLNAGTAPVPTRLRLLCDPSTGLRALVDTVRRRCRSSDQTGQARRRERASKIEARHQALMTMWSDHLTADRQRSSISVPVMVSEVYRAVADLPWLLTLRNTRSWPPSVWNFDRAGRYLGHSGGGGMGYGPGAMLGGALAARDRGQLAVGIVGDGDLLFAPGALWSAAHHQIPMLVVVNNNRSYLNDEEHQERIAIGRNRPVANAAIGTRIEEPPVDFAELARSLGAWAAGPVTAPGELREALQAAVAHALDGSVAVVDVHCDKS